MPRPVFTPLRADAPLPPPPIDRPMTPQEMNDAVRFHPPRNPDAVSMASESVRLDEMEQGTYPSPFRVRNRSRPLSGPPPVPVLATPKAKAKDQQVLGPMASVAGREIQTPRPADFHSISGKSSSENSSGKYSYPNSDEWKDPNGYRLDFPAPLSAPKIPKEKFESVQSEVHGILQFL